MSDTPTPAQPAAPVDEQPKPAAPAQTAQATPETQPQRDAGDSPLGEPGIKALREERAARERLEQAMKDQRTALLKAFGVEEEKPGGDIVATLQEQVASMRHDSLVDRVARRHGITEDADVELLRSTKDEGVMSRLAERLKASNTTPPTPAHDPSQGSAPISAEAAEQAAYEAFFPQTRK